MSTVDDQLVIDVERLAGAAVVQVAGELDVVSVGRLRTTLDRLLLGVEPVVVDLRPLTLIDSAGLGALVRAHKKARVLQGSLTCVCLPESSTMKLIQLTGLHQVLRLAGSVDEALGR